MKVFWWEPITETGEGYYTLFHENSRYEFYFKFIKVLSTTTYYYICITIISITEKTLSNKRELF